MSLFAANIIQVRIVHKYRSKTGEHTNGYDFGIFAEQLLDQQLQKSFAVHLGRERMLLLAEASTDVYAASIRKNDLVLHSV